MGLEDIAQFGFNFDPEDYDSLATSNREVYEVPEEVVNGAGFEGNWVIKFHDPSSRTGGHPLHQNKQETMAYLESRARHQDFIAPVLCGSTDYDWIMIKRLSEFDESMMSPSNSARHRNPVMFDDPREPFSPDIIPDDWSEGDTTEYGLDGGRLKVLDAGMLQPEDDWSIEDPLDESYTRTHDSSGEEYFEVLSVAQEYNIQTPKIPSDPSSLFSEHDVHS